jgi:NADH dehydrogenase (ubiquinone) 1 alpha subcomplex subunit 9
MEPRHLKPMFDLGGLGLLPFSPRDEASIKESIQHSDVVINMIGKHYETKHIVPTRREDGKLSRVNYDFNEVHVDIARNIARLTKEAGIKSFIHVSALAANHDSASEWSRSKARGEDAVREEFPDAIIVKPATIFGPEDRFLNSIADTNEKFPFFPLVNNGETLTQPVYAIDVGQALFNIVQNHHQFKGDTFQLCGPAEYSYREIIEFVQDVSTVSKPMVAMPDSAAQFTGRFIQNLIDPILTEDAIAQMKEDCIAKEGTNMKTLADLGIEPSSMDKYAFDFLHRFRPGGHFTMVQGYH